MTVLTRAIARFLLAPTWVIALAMLVKGYADVGDGFSAGVIAALAILLQYLAFGPEVARTMPPARYVRPLAATGLLLALAVVFAPVLAGDPPMTHWPPPDEHVTHIGSVELITAALFDVGVFLIVLGFCIAAIDLLARSAGGDEG